MKKTSLVLAIVTVLIGVCLAAPVNAATIKLNGKIEYGLELDVTNPAGSLRNSVETTDLDLVLTLASSNVELKLGTNFGLSNIYGDNSNASRVDVDLSYISLKAPGFSFWFTNKETDKIKESIGNDDYQFIPIDFPMGIGSSLLGYTKPITKYFAGFGESDVPARYLPLIYMESTSIYNGKGYAYPNLSLLSTELDYLFNLNADLGRTKIDGYFGKVNFEYSAPYTPEMDYDPYSDRKVTSDEPFELYTGMLRTKINLFGNFNLGSMISFGIVNKGSAEISQGANAGLDLSYDFNNGGKITLAGIASFRLGAIRSAFSDLSAIDGQEILDAFTPIKNGYAFTAGVSNIALDPNGNYRIGVDYTEVQNDAIMPNGSYDYKLLPGTRTVGAEFGVALDALGQPFSVKVRNDVVWRYYADKYVIARDIITLTGNVNINDNYSLSAKVQPTIYFENYDLNYLKNSTAVELVFSGKITDEFTLKAAINYVGSKNYFNNNLSNYAANLVATYSNKFGSFGLVNSSYVNLAGMVGVADSSMNKQANRVKPVTVIYAQAGGVFANNFSIDLAGFASYNSVYGKSLINAPTFNAVLSATGRWYFNPSVCLYLTETYRSWWGLDLGTDYSNFYTEIGFRVKTTNGIFVQLSVGNSGLANESKTDITQYSNVMPWSWLEIIPEKKAMNFTTINLNVRIQF